MRNMIIAFILNTVFAVFEYIGGMYTNSVALTSDAIHDLGDAVSIGIACIMEKRSKKPADDEYTFGYSRFSILSAMKTSAILITGSIAIIINTVTRIVNPEPINYNGMLIFAIIGLIFNTLAAFFTRHGDSLNQKSINLHMLEDVLGWVIVLIGAVIMKFTDFALLDILLSLGTSGFILINSLINIRKTTNILTEKTPKNINIRKLKTKIRLVDGVDDIHHFRLWSLDEHNMYAIIHVVVNENFSNKQIIRDIFHEFGVTNTTIEIENSENPCSECEHIVSSTTHTHYH